MVRLAITANFPVTTSATGAPNTVVYPQLVLPLNFPGRGIIYDGVTSSGYGPVTAFPGAFISTLYTTLFTGANPVFEEYKVLSLRFRFIPNTLVVNSIATVITSADQNCIFYYNDKDDSTLTTTNVEGHYLNNGVLPLQMNEVSKRGINHSYRQIKEKRKFFFNMSAWQALPGGAVTYNNMMMPSPFSSMKIMWKQSLGANPSFIGNATVTWDCIFRGVDQLL